MEGSIVNRTTDNDYMQERVFIQEKGGEESDIEKENSDISDNEYRKYIYVENSDCETDSEE